MNMKDTVTALAIILVLIVGSLVASDSKAALIHVENEKLVYFFGPFQSDDDVVNLKAALEGKKNVTVRFHSGGGSVAIGVAVAEVIAEAGASTHVVKHSHCASICAYAWLAGKHRTVAEGAYLGVHNVYQGFAQIASMSPIEYQHQSLKTIGILMYRAEKGGYGAPMIYWANLLATPFDKMYTFTREELKEIER